MNKFYFNIKKIFAIINKKDVKKLSTIFLTFIFMVGFFIILLPKINSVDIIIEINNNPPNKPTNPKPYDGETDVSVNPTLYVFVSDSNNDSIDVYFYNAYDDSLINIDRNISGKGIASVDWLNLKYDTTYEWYVVANDSRLDNKSDTWSFKTRINEDQPPQNNPPVAIALSSDTTALTGEEIQFDGSMSYDTDGFITNYEWDFGDGNTSTEKTVFHSYSNEGIYNVVLTVIDDYNANDTDSLSIIISVANYPPTKPIITGPKTGEINKTYEFTALSFDLDNDTIQYILNWGDGNEFNTSFYENGTLIYINHSWDNFGEYTILIKAYDGKTYSETSDYTIIIGKILIIDDIIEGNLIDGNDDDTYDYFEDTDSGKLTKVIKYNDTTYILDTKGNDKWDYVYSLDTEETNDIDEYISHRLPGFDIATFIAMIIVVVLIMFYKKRK